MSIRRIAVCVAVLSLVTSACSNSGSGVVPAGGPLPSGRSTSAASAPSTGASSTGSAAPAMSPTPLAPAAAIVPVSIVVDVAGPALAGSAIARRPEALSASVRSVGVTFSSSLGAPHGLDASEPSTCSSAANGAETCVFPVAAPVCPTTSGSTDRLCTFVFAAYAGPSTYAVTAFDGPAGTGRVVASTAPVSVSVPATSASTPFSLTPLVPAPASIVGKIVVSFGGGGVEGTPATIPASIQVYDIDGTLLPTGAPLAETISLALSDTSGATSLSATSVSTAGAVVSIAYTGARLASPTLSASVPGAPALATGSILTIVGYGTFPAVTTDRFDYAGSETLTGDPQYDDTTLCDQAPARSFTYTPVVTTGQSFAGATNLVESSGMVTASCPEGTVLSRIDSYFDLSRPGAIYLTGVRNTNDPLDSTATDYSYQLDTYENGGREYDTLPEASGSFDSNVAHLHEFHSLFGKGASAQTSDLVRTTAADGSYSETSISASGREYDSTTQRQDSSGNGVYTNDTRDSSAMPSSTSPSATQTPEVVIVLSGLSGTTQTYDVPTRPSPTAVPQPNPPEFGATAYPTPFVLPTQITVPYSNADVSPAESVHTIESGPVQIPLSCRVGASIPTTAQKIESVDRDIDIWIGATTVTDDRYVSRDYGVVCESVSTTLVSYRYATGPLTVTDTMALQSETLASPQQSQRRSGAALGGAVGISSAFREFVHHRVRRAPRSRH